MKCLLCQLIWGIHTGMLDAYKYLQHINLKEMVLAQLVMAGKLQGYLWVLKCIMLLKTPQKLNLNYQLCLMTEQDLVVLISMELL